MVREMVHGGHSHTSRQAALAPGRSECGSGNMSSSWIGMAAMLSSGSSLIGITLAYGCLLSAARRATDSPAFQHTPRCFSGSNHQAQYHSILRFDLCLDTLFGLDLPEASHAALPAAGLLFGVIT